MIKGKDIALFSDTRSYTQGVGYSHRLEYHALIKTRLNPIMAQLVAQGYNCTVDKMGSSPKWSLVAVSAGPQDGSTESPVDRWSWRKELVQRSIWSKPDVAAIVRVGTGGQIRTTIEEGISQKKTWAQIETLTGITSLLPAQKTTLQKVYNELVASSESYELEYLVLTRTRATRIGYPQRLTLSATSKIYTTAQLTSTFSVPSDVSSILPDSSTQVSVDAQSQWGWRLRDESGDREGFIRFAEQTSWVFASWSTFLYTPA